MDAVVIDPKELLTGRAARSLSEVPRPFLRWAGSKQKLLSDLIAHLPATIGTYYEPFVGGGSLYFLLRPRRAVLSDASPDLIHTYRAVRDGPRGVLRHMEQLRPLDKEQFYRVRAQRSNSRFQRAAEFIYLNRSCFNGLYRVNLKGQFNVPYGSPQSNVIAEPANIHACSALLQTAQSIEQRDFQTSVDAAVEGDFVFLDPPYVTGHNNNGFIDYNQKLFRWEDQIRLASAARRAAERGAHVMVTNANHDAVRLLYSGFKMVEISRSSTLAGQRAARRTVTEALFTSF